jgi:hypothetical protein
MNPLFKTIAIVLSVAGVMSALLSRIERARTQPEFVSLFHSMQGTNITKIVISDNSGSVLNSVSAPVALAIFAKAVNAVEPYSPNHPGYLKEFYVELYLVDGQKREFEFHTMPSDQTIYVDFVQRNGAMTSYYGNCKSAALFDWMKEQTPNNLP